MRTTRRLTAAVVAAAATTSLAVTGAASADPAPATKYTPGPQSVGDPWYPTYGNGGYDAQHYAITMAFDPAGFRINATTTLTARATQNLSSFSLDLDGLAVSAVTTNGRTARFTRTGHKLVVVPAHGIDRGLLFDVAVTYAGSPRPLGSGPTQTGFLQTNDGAFTLTNSVASDTWFPNNDHPSDKATYAFAVTTPSDLVAVANGQLTSVRHGPAGTTYSWVENAPMASYLTTVDIGKWQLATSRTPSGVSEYVAVDPQLNGTDPDHPNALPFIQQTTAQVIDEWSQLFGPYPFASTGGIADYTDIDGQPAGFSEESQTKPVYGSVLDPLDISHELSHQWFGDSVSITNWSEIWLNEGFATWAALYWDGTHGGTPVEQAVREQYVHYAANSSYWTIPVTPAPKPGTNPNTGARVYYGGAMALEFLRERVGDDAFFRILRTWATTYRYGNATTAQFAAIATRVSGQNLSQFFADWVYGTGKPPLPSSGQ